MTSDDLKGSPVWGEYEYALREKRVGALLARFNFSRANLQKANLNGANLVGANLNGAKLWDANFSGAELRQADLSGARLAQANLSGANLRRAKLSGAHLWNANLSGAHLWNANLSGANLQEGNLRGANLWNANLSGANLQEANLSGARLWSAVCSPLGLPKLRNSPDPELAPFPPPQPTFMSGCILTSADLTGADFTQVDLSGAYLANATLTNAIFNGTNVTSVNYVRRLLAKKCYGVNADGMYGDATFRRDVMDQDYIDTLYTRTADEWPKLRAKPGTFLARLPRFISSTFIFLPWLNKELDNATANLSTWFAAVLATIGSWILFQSNIKAEATTLCPAMFPAAVGGIAVGLFFNTWFGRRFLLALWSLLGYGRDWDRVAIFASVMIGILGYIYSTYGCYQATCDASHAFQFFDGKQPLDQHPIYPWYIAALGFATLGISDLIRPLTGFGMLIVSLNVLAGFSTLGLLLAVLSDRFARRA